MKGHDSSFTSTEGTTGSSLNSLDNTSHSSFSSAQETTSSSITSRTSALPKRHATFTFDEVSSYVSSSSDEDEGDSASSSNEETSSSTSSSYGRSQSPSNLKGKEAERKVDDTDAPSNTQVKRSPSLSSGQSDLDVFITPQGRASPEV